MDDILSILFTGPAPARGSAGAAGWDLVASAAAELAPGAVGRIPTGLRLALPPGHVGLIRDRSSVATRERLIVVAGVIDADYRGEVQVALLNLSGAPARVEAGQRVAQLLVVRTPEVAWREVEALPPSDRGEQGFGSTGR